MSLYLHIPFCHSKCTYCGFYSVASSAMRTDWIEALCNEIVARKNELGHEAIHNTLYFGGGTPSMLTPGEWHRIITCLEQNYKISETAERTLEANPEDITIENATLWKNLGFNRISIGVQSLNDNALKACNRRHTANEARTAIENAHKAGFQNIGVDFIIGLPNADYNDIELAAQLLQQFPITHVSLYILSIDEGSIMHKRVQQGKFTPLSDDEEADLYNQYCQMIKGAGFEHYEISNFAKPGYQSQHNTAYWEQKPYLGFGTAAHSYNGKECRRWNIANIKSYSQAWLNGAACAESGYEQEFLEDSDLYNELIMTRLRTSKGIPTQILESEKFNKFWKLSQPALQKYIAKGVAKIEENHLFLTEEGWLISDAIFADLFY